MRRDDAALHELVVAQELNGGKRIGDMRSRWLGWTCESCPRETGAEREPRMPKGFCVSCVLCAGAD
eukprot:5662227-Pleurochrysis_carterae.AAC.2